MLDTFTKKNGRTNFFYTEIDFCRANKKIEDCFALASDMLLNTKFSKKGVESEKGVINQELVQKLNNPHTMHYFAELRSLSSEYNKNTCVLGSQEEINSITPKILKDFRDNTFISQNFVITIEGGISYFKAKRLAKKYFISKLKSKPDYNVDRTMIHNYDRQGNMVVENFPFKKSTCSIIFKVDKSLESIKTNQTMRMFSNICNEFNGKLVGKMRDNGLIYSGALGWDDIPDHNLIQIYWECSSDNVNKCFDTISEVLSDLRKNTVDEKLIQKKIENYKLSRDEATQINIYPSRLFYKYLTYGKDDFSRKTNKAYKKAYESLTAKDVQDFCNQVFTKPENIHVTILTGEEKPNFYSYEQIQKMLTSGKKAK